MFSISDSNGVMHSLTQDYNIFNLKGVIAKCNSRMKFLRPYIYKTKWHPYHNWKIRIYYSKIKCLWWLKKYNIAFSCLIIEALILLTYRETVKTRFSHHKDFTELPGQIYFITLSHFPGKKYPRYVPKRWNSSNKAGRTLPTWTSSYQSVT